jgi:hypothetical protein
MYSTFDVIPESRNSASDAETCRNIGRPLTLIPALRQALRPPGIALPGQTAMLPAEPVRSTKNGDHSGEIGPAT